MPPVSTNYVFKAKLLPDAVLPKRRLDSDDYEAIQMGYNARGRGRGRGRTVVHRIVQHGLSLRSRESSQQYANRGRFDHSNRGSDEYGRINRGGYDRRRNSRDESRIERDFYKRDRNLVDEHERDTRGSRNSAYTPYMGGGGYSNRDYNGKFIVIINLHRAIVMTVIIVEIRMGNIIIGIIIILMTEIIIRIIVIINIMIAQLMTIYDIISTMKNRRTIIGRIFRTSTESICLHQTSRDHLRRIRVRHW
jgi:hypothetical protein